MFLCHPSHVRLTEQILINTVAYTGQVNCSISLGAHFYASNLFSCVLRAYLQGLCICLNLTYVDTGGGLKLLLLL